MKGLKKCSKSNQIIFSFYTVLSILILSLLPFFQSVSATYKDHIQSINWFPQPAQNVGLFGCNQANQIEWWISHLNPIFSSSHQNQKSNSGSKMHYETQYNTRMKFHTDLIAINDRTFATRTKEIGEIKTTK